MFINTFIASNDHIRKIICFIVTCSVIHCHLVKAHVQLKVAHFVTYLCVLATTMTTPLLGMTTKMGLSPVCVHAGLGMMRTLKLVTAKFVAAATRPREALQSLSLARRIRKIDVRFTMHRFQVTHTHWHSHI